MQFEDVHRLSDGQVKHSPEVFYAGSLWKVLKYLLIVLYIYISLRYMMRLYLFTMV